MGEWRYSAVYFQSETERKLSAERQAMVALLQEKSGENAPSSQWVRGWVDPRVGQEAMVKFVPVSARELYHNVQVQFWLPHFQARHYLRV
jgi:hypothetical protein